MPMFQNYVLKSGELIQAVLLGCKELGLVPDEVADAALKNPDSVSFEQVVNGGLLGIDSELAADAPKAPRSNGAEKARPAAAPTAAGDQGPAPEKVKAALGASMDNPPRLSTIRNWNPTQRRKALKWAKHPETERPDFIVSPAPRGSRTPAAPAEPGANAPEEPAPAPAAGNKSENASRRAAASKPSTNPEEDDDDDDDEDDEDDNGSQFFADDPNPEAPEGEDPPGG
jgi:hypothetical protein